MPGGVDYLLEAIAPRVLCSREDHQRQAPVLVARWEREIAAFEALDNNPRPVPGGTHTYETTRARYDYHAPLDVDSRRCRMYQRIKDMVQELREQIRDIHPWGTNPGFLSFPHFPRGRDPALQEDNGGAQYSSTFDRPYIEPASYTVESLSNYAESSYTEQPSVSQTSTYKPHRQPVEGDCSICLGSLHEAPLLPKPNPATSWQWSPTDSAPSADYYENWYEEWGWWNYISGSRGIGSVNHNEDENEEGSVSWCRATCGVNFHARCMDDWLNAADRATCPVCRSAWVFS